MSEGKNMGIVPGFRYEFVCGSDPEDCCLFCSRNVLVVRADEVGGGICETCAMLVQWIWKRSNSELPPNASFAGPGVECVVLAVRFDERGNAEVAMVPDPRVTSTKKGEPGAWMLPAVFVGDKVVTTENTAAVIALDQAGITTWQAGLEVLWSGLNIHGNLTRVFLARGWHERRRAQDQAGACTWKSWPPAAHAGPMAAFYEGLDSALGMRIRLHKTESTVEWPSISVRANTVRYINMMLDRLEDRPTEDGGSDEDRDQLIAAIGQQLLPDEKTIATIVVRSAESARKMQGRMLGPKTGDREQVQTEKKAVERAPIVGEHVVRDESTEQEGEEEGEVEGDESGEGGFVRRAGPDLEQR